MTPRPLSPEGPVIARVVVRRANGRFVTDVPVHSRYQLRRAVKKLDARYDNTYQIEVEERS